MNKPDLRNKFLSIASASTAYDSKTYAGGLQGHCFCVAILVQKMFGGDIVTSKINGVSHAWNKLPNGECVDFTSCQFGGDGFTPLSDKYSVRKANLSNKRFVIFEQKFLELDSN